MRRTDAKDFVSSVLPALVKQLYAGADFAFGRGRGGQVDTINDYGVSAGIVAFGVPLLQDENSVVISLPNPSGVASWRSDPCRRDA